jgi:hypothetical protein
MFPFLCSVLGSPYGSGINGRSGELVIAIHGNWDCFLGQGRHWPMGI